MIFKIDRISESNHVHPENLVNPVLNTDPLLAISGKQPADVARDFVRGDRPSAKQKLLVRVAERVRDLFARVFPLVNELLEHARVRVLRDEARAQHLESLARDLGNDRRIVQEPPATKRHQVVELPRRHTQLMLVLTRKKCR